MFGRSKHLFSWRASNIVIPKMELQSCVCSVTIGKKRDDVSRKRQCTRTRSCWVGRRERSSTPPASHVLNVDYRAFAKHVQNVFVSFSALAFRQKNPPTHQCAHRAPLLKLLALAPIASRTSTCSERRQLRCLWNTNEFCRAPLPIHDCPNA